MGFLAIKAVLGKGDCFELLADLIEPDTCVMSFVEEEMMEATYRCSNCNGTVNTLALYGYEFPFCPYCGAKVEKVDDSETQQGNMVSLISVVKVLLRQKVMLSILVDILIGTAAINRALNAAERKADD